MTYSDMEEHAIAQRWLERCLSASDSAESHVRKANSLLVNSLKSQGQLREAHEECLRALHVFPLDVELLFRRGMLEHDLGNFEAAISAYRSILDSQEERHFVSMDVGLVDYKTHNNLALVYQDSGQLALAEIQWRSIIAQKPNFEEAWQGLGRNLIDQHKWIAMDLLLTELHKQPHGSANISWLRAIVAEKQGETAGMRPLLDAALAVNPAHALARQDYCRWLFHFGSVEEAAKALEELVERDPTDAAALHNLGLIYVRTGLHEQAKNAFDRSLELRPNSEITRRELERVQLDLAKQVPTQREIVPRELEHSNTTRKLGNNTLDAFIRTSYFEAPQIAAHVKTVPAAMNSDQSGQPERPLDLLYLFCHSPYQDREMLYSLRSVAANLPFINKVWIFGDRPHFLTEDTNIVEHIPHEAIAPLFGFRTPVRNDFLMLFLASLIPDLAFEFVRFCDDYIVLQPLTQQRLCTWQAKEDMNQISVRGRGVFKDFLWNTYDTLNRLGYPGLNFEGHLPQHYDRKIVFDAFREFRDFVSQDRFFGMASTTAVCNFAVKKHSKPFVWMESENSKVGIYQSCPAKDEIDSICLGKTFLNFTDKTFGEPLCNFLNERFSKPCKYEWTFSSRSDAEAFHDPGFVYVRSGLREQAKNAFDGSLELRPNSEVRGRELEQAQLLQARQSSAQHKTIPREIEQSQLAFHSSPTTMMKVQSVQPEKPLDIVYLFRHSPNQDKEMLYSLRSVAANLPYINKVWIFGDKPLFLTEDTSIVEHIPHEAIAPAFGFRIPVRNDFLMFFLASLIPDLAFDFVKFCDDYVVLQPITQLRLCTLRAMEDMNKLPVRGRGGFKDFLWYTYDTLKRLGYFGLSFEGHVPQPYNRKIVFDAFREFRDFVSQDRYFGMASSTAVCNFAVQKHSKPFIWLDSENSKVGFYKSSPTKDEIDSICSGKTFLNFTDKTFGVSMCNFLNERFSIPSKYESATL